MKESQQGRLSETILNDIVQEVEKIESLVSALPLFGGPQEYQNGWMNDTMKQLLQEETKTTEEKPGNFINPTIFKASIDADYGSKAQLCETPTGIQLQRCVFVRWWKHSVTRP